MSDTTSTGAGSNGSEADKTADSATGGEGITETGDGSTKKIKELETTITGYAQKTRKLEKSLKDVTSKLDTVLSRLTSSAGDDGDDDDDDDADDGSEGDQDAKPGEGKQKGGKPGEKNPEVRNLLRKLNRTREDYEKQLGTERTEKDQWKSRFLEAEKRKVIEAELSKHDVLPHAKADLIEQLERKVEVEIDEDGTVEVSHKDYPHISKFLEEFLNDRPHVLRNTKAGGTGDDGGAEKTGGNASGGLPANFANWTPQRQSEWFNNLKPEQRRALGKKITL